MPAIDAGRIETTMTTETKPKNIKITLSDRAPVTVDPQIWPSIANNSVHSGEHECQANERAWIRVRRHADGRTIIYGEREDGPGGTPVGQHGAEAGYLLDAGEDTVRAIRRVAGVLVDGAWQLGAADIRWLADAVISDLPAEQLD